MMQIQIDITFLREWIRAEHLEEAQLRMYRDMLQSHGSRFVVLRSFLTDSVAEKLSRFLQREAQFHTEYGLYSVHDQGVPEERWQSAIDQDRFFRFGKLVGTSPEFAMSPNALTYLRFRKTFQDPRFRNFYEHLCGTQLGSSDDFGSHSMAVGDMLRPHSDDNRNRRVAIVIYLSPDWETSYGGALHIVDRQGRVSSIEAAYNTMIAFDVLAETTHYVTSIDPAAGTRRRLTIGGWYPNP